MDGYTEREDISEVIESTLATFDYEMNDQMNDNDAIQILEMLLDVYYFVSVRATASRKSRG